MILYHGSNMLFDVVLLEMSKEKRDFGKGFYMTTIKEQARGWAEALNFRKKKDGMFLYEFELTNSSNLNTKSFDGISEEWLDFVKENREKGGIQHNYDVVIGPVANDRIMETIGFYLSGIYSSAEALLRLSYMKPNDQVSIHTEKALANLKFIRRTEWSA
jgi:hypothetical protein